MATRVTGGEVGRDLALFAVTLVLAVTQRWQAVDLVWSLWVASLTLGYAFILTSIGSMLVRSPAGPLLGGFPSTATEPEDPRQKAVGQAVAMNVFILFVAWMILGFRGLPRWLLAALLVSSALAVGGLLRHRPGWGFFPDPSRGLVRLVVLAPLGAFFLGFFTVHFVGFHFVHSIFLNGMFPLLPEAAPFGKTMDENATDFLWLIRVALERYWPFVAASGMSRFTEFRAAARATDDAMMVRPYLNVVRMHVMIFVFVGLAAAGLSGLALYPLLAAYFLPVGSLVRAVRRPGTDAAAPAPSDPI